MLIVRGLEKFFGGRSLFKPIDFTAQPSQLYLIKGPNGSGKTTLLKCLSGHLQFEKGQIEFLGNKSAPLHRISGLYLFQENSFFPQLSLRENIDFYKKYFSSQENLHPLIEELGLLPWWDKRFQECSSGIKRRLGILRSLLNQPKILLLDEPLSFMDETFSENLGKFLVQQTKEKNLITFISSNQELPTPLEIHNMIEVHPC